MTELAPLLLSAWVLGLLGGGHCLGMCGGLMGALTMAIPPEQRAKRLRLLLAYNLGRVASYAVAGFLIGLAGWAIANSPAATALRVVAALLLISMGLYLAGWWSGLTRVEALGRGLWRHIQPVASRLMPVTSLPRALVLGAALQELEGGFDALLLEHRQRVSGQGIQRVDEPRVRALHRDEAERTVEAVYLRRCVLLAERQEQLAQRDHFATAGPLVPALRVQAWAGDTADLLLPIGTQHTH